MNKKTSAFILVLIVVIGAVLLLQNKKGTHETTSSMDTIVVPEETPIQQTLPEKKDVSAIEGLYTKDKISYVLIEPVDGPASNNCDFIVRDLADYVDTSYMTTRESFCGEKYDIKSAQSVFPDECTIQYSFTDTSMTLVQMGTCIEAFKGLKDTYTKISTLTPTLARAKVAHLAEVELWRRSKTGDLDFTMGSTEGTDIGEDFVADIRVLDTTHYFVDVYLSVSRGSDENDVLGTYSVDFSNGEVGQKHPFGWPLE